MALLAITRATLLGLRRGPVFIPVLILIGFLAIFASIASSWGIAEFRKILFDIGSFSFHITGNFIAIFWAVKVLVMSRLDGSIETQLASPVSRPLWILGRALGLGFALVVLGFSLTFLWQIMMFLTGFGLMRSEELFSFLSQILGWLVISSVGLFFASFCGLVTAIFAAFASLVAGLMTELIVSTLREEDNVWSFLAYFFKILSKLWNLQVFNRSPAFFLEGGGTIFLWTTSYAFLLISLFLCATALIFSRKEAVF